MSVRRPVEDFLSPRNTTVEILDFTRFCKNFYVIFQRDRIFLKKPISPKDIYRLSNHLSPKTPAIG